MGEPAVRRWGTKGRWGIWAFECKRLDGQGSWHLRAGSLTLGKALSRLDVLNRNARPQLAVPLLSAPSAVLDQDAFAGSEGFGNGAAATAAAERCMNRTVAREQYLCASSRVNSGRLWHALSGCLYQQPDVLHNVPWMREPKQAWLGL